LQLLRACVFLYKQKMECRAATPPTSKWATWFSYKDLLVQLIEHEPF